ncbi:MAG: Cell division coordinator CpoB [Candidatus Scalindua arabica]|uniref:Cell division coordinator CpoB n=1 Tax=Candidatus Scalindua arabica TaxID=1127984 RepID=A0A941W546_9BACT|nr:Cell division coordinator CpoB [Candidatus Scalindua arabica]
MEATKERIRNFTKFFQDYGLWIAIGIGVAVAAGVPTYLFSQKGAKDFNEVWSRVYQINYELSVAENEGPEKKTEALEGAISEYTFLKDNLSTTDATPWLLLELGNAQYKAKKHDEAIVTYREFLARFGKHPLAPIIRHSLGYALEEKGELKEAIEQFEEIARAPESTYLKAQVKLDAGRCYEKLGELTSAVAAYKDVIGSFPESSSAKMAAYRLEDIE